MGRESQPIRTVHSVNVNHVAGPDPSQKADQGVGRGPGGPPHNSKNVKLFLRGPLAFCCWLLAVISRWHMHRVCRLRRYLAVSEGTVVRQPPPLHKGQPLSSRSFKVFFSAVRVTSIPITESVIL